MQAGTATVIGATGLIGSHLVDLLRQDETFQAVRVLVRRPYPAPSSKVQVRVLDFSDAQAFQEAIAGSEAVFCAVGTTQKKVKGDRQAYRKVDFDIPVSAARLAAGTGCRRFLLVSSVGADSRSNTFYLRLKGEVEEAVRKAGIAAVDVFRPSMLLGEREESRPAERLGQALMGRLAFLIPSAYKPIPARDVAKAMVAAAKGGKPGFRVHHYREMMR